jgi:hypothetical protein
LALAIPLFAAAGQPPPEKPEKPPRGPKVTKPAKVGVSRALKNIPRRPIVPGPPRQILNKVRFSPPGKARKVAAPDLTRQSLSGPTSSAGTTPQPIQSFEGTSDDDNAEHAGVRVVPPDTEGDVGPNHYVQMNNLVFEIFDKNGTSVYGPVPNNILWDGFGGPCETNNDGDPIVLYDQGADRWIFSQFAIAADGGHQCFAISTTPDPTEGQYHLYDYLVSAGGFNDYPKIGLWPDGYYLTANEFAQIFLDWIYVSPIVVAFERDKMLVGDPTALGVKFSVLGLFDTFFSLQPSHWEGPKAPPPQAPNVIAMAFDNEAWGMFSGPDGYRLWEFAVNWNDPIASTLTALGQLNAPEFDSNLCNFVEPCVPQPNPGEKLDSFGQFTMYRAPYRNFGTHQSILVSHTVDADGQDTAGIRWAELRKTNGGWQLHQTGTYAPADGSHRWMGSIAMDGTGNIALGYSVSGSNVFPSIRYTSRTPGDPAGEMSGGEVECYAGTGVQRASFNRWGDYSTMSVDPTDDCTFWYTQQYYQKSGSFDFKTRVCVFALPSCSDCIATEETEISCTDGEDNDCDGLADCADPDCSGGPDCTTCPDADVDGFTDADCGGLDCDDSDASINPGAQETCDDFVDNDCDGDADCVDSDCSTDPYCEPPCWDNDGDFYYDVACGGDDCDDGDESINPGADESCNDFFDNNCDELVDCDELTCSSDPVCQKQCLPKRAPCTSDAECCSGKCRGKRKRTCK